MGNGMITEDCPNKCLFLRCQNSVFTGFLDFLCPYLQEKDTL